MRTEPVPPKPDRWVSVSELADYAFCPRSQYYRHHPPPSGRTAESREDGLRGTEYHARFLSMRRRGESLVRLWAGLALVAGGALALLLWMILARAGWP